jgi:hypothetical protein
MMEASRVPGYVALGEKVGGRLLSPHSHVGGYVSGTYAVNLDIVLAPLIAQGLRELT